MATADLTAARLREVLDYDADTGAFTWRAKLAQRTSIGGLAGTKRRDGYARISIDGAKHLAHRLAWLHAYGCWPSGCIDHINGLKGDNRLSNLRDAPVAVNNQNVRAARKDSRSGVQGVRAVGNRFEARGRVDGRRQCLGFFATEAEASAAYVAAKRLHQPGFAG
jgi:hypothetical protein